MTKSIPGQRLDEIAKRMQSSEAIDAAFKNGFYHCDYVVTSNPKIPLRPEFEKIRVAAHTRWQNRLISFYALNQWLRDGAEDPFTCEPTIEDTLGREQDLAVLLIKNGVFTKIGNRTTLVC